MGKVCIKGKGRGGVASVSKRNRAFKAYMKKVHRKRDLARKS